jgi:hypothetical protein
MGAKVFLAQLPDSMDGMQPPDGYHPSLLAGNRRAIAPGGGANGRSQAFLWAEILSEVTVLKDTPKERIPALIDCLAADMGVLTTPDMGLSHSGYGRSLAVDWFSSLHVPILIFNVLNRTRWAGNEFRRILVPITSETDLGLQIRFACRFAKRHHGRLTVLRVFDGPGIDEDHPERTPDAVRARLPISELKREGILCPMEIAVSEGFPGRAILDFNHKKPHDLVIMEGSRRGTLDHGSGFGNLHTVTTDASCPVLVLGRGMYSAAESADSISPFSLAREPQMQELSTQEVH